MKALVVDDARTMRMILGKILKDIGYVEVSEAADGQLGLDKLNEIGPVDLILADWNMPNMNGLEMVRNIRKNDTFRNVTIMMVTTETEYDQVVRALAAGANEYAMKPFTKEVIIDKLGVLGLLPEYQNQS